jgi:DNA-binding SARP family transcriptional activator
VSTDELIELTWDGKPPKTARAALQNYITRLRRALDEPMASKIRTMPSGYLIELSESELDLTLFTRLRNLGRDSFQAGNWPEAEKLLRHALSLWRGSPLTGISTVGLAGAIAALEETWLQTVEWWIDADMQLGRHEDVIAELQRLTEANPLRERLSELLMLALYRSSRQAEALAIYRDTRRVLVKELGVEPGPELRELHRRMLAGDPSLIAAELVQSGTNGRAWASVGIRPAQLPADTADFTGRRVQARRLRLLLTGNWADSRKGAPPVGILTGGPGIGKSALATHVAHLVRDEFPDGQLYVQLHGSGPTPMAAGDVLARLLRDMGTPPSAVPGDEQEQETLYRSLLADRRVLIVLDDAKDAVQVLPIIPGTASCGVIITSRRSLAGIAGAQVVELPALDDHEARQLFGRIATVKRTAGEPEAVSEVLRICAGLPLAIRIAASRLATRPDWSVATLADRLSDQQRRLDELSTDFLALRSSFAASYVSLDGHAEHPSALSRAFRLLGLWPGPSVSLQAASELLGGGDVAATLETLIDLHLLECRTPGRYYLHDLLRVYAAERALEEETAEERSAATRRLLSWYLQVTAAANEWVAVPCQHVEMGLPSGASRVAFSTYAEALAFLDVESSNLVAAVALAPSLGLHDIAWKLALTMDGWFRLRKPWKSWVATQETGLASARHLGDLRGEAWIRGKLAIPLLYREEALPDALDQLYQAREIHLRQDDELSLVNVLVNIGLARQRLGNLGAAEEYMIEAITIARKVGSEVKESAALVSLANLQQELGRSDDALWHGHRALAIARRTEDIHVECAALILVGRGYYLAGHFTDAVTSYKRAITISHELGDGYLGCWAEDYLGQIQAESGDHQAAENHFRRALDLAQTMGRMPMIEEIRGRIDALGSEYSGLQV